MDKLKAVFNKYLRTGVIVIIGVTVIVYIAFGFLYWQQGNLQKETESKINQIKPVLSKELPSRAELEAEYNAVLATFDTLTDRKAIEMLVMMADDNDIDVSETAGKFRVPVPGHKTAKVGQASVNIVSFGGVSVQGAPDDVFKFLENIQSGYYIKAEDINIETMLLTSISVTDVDVQFAGEEGTRRSEFRTVQAAVTDMMEDNGLASIPNPIKHSGGIAANFMGDNPATGYIIEGFPDNTTSPFEKGYSGNVTIKNGFVLFGHHKPLSDNPTQYQVVNYISGYQTVYYYTCESDGLVRQWSDADLNTAIEYTETAPSTMELKVTINIDIYCH